MAITGITQSKVNVDLIAYFHVNQTVNRTQCWWQKRLETNGLGLNIKLIDSFFLSHLILFLLKIKKEINCWDNSFFSQKPT